MKSRNALATLGAWLALALAPAPTAAHAATGTLEGRVVNARSGEYLEKARVTVEGTSVEAFTDASGQYRLVAVPTGLARIEVFFTGLETLKTTVEVRAGETVQRDFELRDAVVKLSEFVVGASREMDGAAIAINEQRFAPNIRQVVTSGEFGISADGSVGEFMKYLPGISVDYVGGTANTISVEGAPANNVPVTIGGFDLASTSSASTSRAVELLQISIQNIARLELVQSPTPESPGSALAGSINLVPRTAFERSRPLFTGSVYLMMRDNYRVFHRTEGPRRAATYKVQPGFDFSYIVPVNRRFGFTLSGGYSRQFLPQDTVQTSWRPVAGGTNGTALPHTTYDRPYLGSYQLLDQIKFNDRRSLGATLDYKVSDRSALSFSYQYGQFGSEYDGNQIAWTIQSVTAFDFSPGAKFTRGTGNIQLTNSARWRDGKTHMPSLVYRHNGPVWRLEAGAGLSWSNNVLRDTSRGYFGALTAQRTGVTLSFDNITYLRPETITVTNTTGGTPVNWADLGSYTLVSAGSPNPRDSVDVKRNAYANAARDFELASVPFTLKAGLDARESMRDIRGSNTSLNFVGPDRNAALVLNDALAPREEPFGFGKIQWLSAEKAWDLYQAYPQYFSGNANSDYRNAISLSKHVSERVLAAYLRGDVALFQRRLKLVGGLRAEQTNIDAEGPRTDPTLNYRRDASGAVLRGPTGSPLLIVPTSDALGVSKLTFLDRSGRGTKEYFRLFPSLNASFAFNDNWVARASAYTSVGRPDYNQYAGGIILPDTEALNRSPIQVANVAIKAWQATTQKLRLEYYFGHVGELSIGGFRREFKNFFASDQFDVTADFLAHYDLDPAVWSSYQVITTRNLSSNVRMTGCDVAYKQALTFLPSWARGVQAFANLTALRTIGDDNANFSGYTPRTINWGASLTRQKFTVRANWNYQGRRRLLPITGTGVEPGTFNWRSSRLNLDVQGEYYFYKRFAAFANLRNLKDATEDQEILGPSTPEIAQFRRREDYGASWTFGIKGTF